MIDKAVFAALIDEFGSGWSSADVKRLLAPFADHAVFLAEPFAEPLTGIRTIEEYWRDVALEQAEIQFRSGEVYVAGPWCATEFRCTFRRRRTGQKMDVRGALFIETDGRKIVEMRMYWHREAGPK